MLITLAGIASQEPVLKQGEARRHHGAVLNDETFGCRGIAAEMRDQCFADVADRPAGNRPAVDGGETSSTTLRAGTVTSFARLRRDRQVGALGG